MARGSKKKDTETGSKTRTSPRKHHSGTAGVEEEEASTVQLSQGAEAPEAPEALDEDAPTQTLSSPFTAEQDEQIAAFFKDHKLFYDLCDRDNKNKKKRDRLLLEFAQSLFPSGKSILQSLLEKFVT